MDKKPRFEIKKYKATKELLEKVSLEILADFPQINKHSLITSYLPGLVNRVINSEKEKTKDLIQKVLTTSPNYKKDIVSGTIKYNNEIIPIEQYVDKVVDFIESYSTMLIDEENQKQKELDEIEKAKTKLERDNIVYHTDEYTEKHPLSQVDPEELNIENNEDKIDLTRESEIEYINNLLLDDSLDQNFVEKLQNRKEKIQQYVDFEKNSTEIDKKLQLEEVNNKEDKLDMKEKKPKPIIMNEFNALGDHMAMFPNKTKNEKTELPTQDSVKDNTLVNNKLNTGDKSDVINKKLEPNVENKKELTLEYVNSKIKEIEQKIQDAVHGNRKLQKIISKMGLEKAKDSKEYKDIFDREIREKIIKRKDKDGFNLYDYKDKREELKDLNKKDKDENKDNNNLNKKQNNTPPNAPVIESKYSKGFEIKTHEEYLDVIKEIEILKAEINKRKEAQEKRKEILKAAIEENEQIKKRKEEIKRQIEELQKAESNTENTPQSEPLQAENTQENELVETESEIELNLKADLPQGKVGNTNYEVKGDNVYFEGKKLDNPENKKTHRQLIEADIKRRKLEELNKDENQPFDFYPRVDLREADTETKNKFYENEKKNKEQFEKRNKINAKYDAELKALEQQPKSNQFEQDKKAEIEKEGNKGIIELVKTKVPDSDFSMLEDETRKRIDLIEDSKNIDGHGILRVPNGETQLGVLLKILESQKMLGDWGKISRDYSKPYSQQMGAWLSAPFIVVGLPNIPLADKKNNNMLNPYSVILNGWGEGYYDILSKNYPNVNFIVGSELTKEQLLNAKYDAQLELKALEQSTSTTQSESNPALSDVESTAKKTIQEIPRENISFFVSGGSGVDHRSYPSNKTTSDYDLSNEKIKQGGFRYVEHSDGTISFHIPYNGLDSRGGSHLGIAIKGLKLEQIDSKNIKQVIDRLGDALSKIPENITGDERAGEIERIGNEVIETELKTLEGINFFKKEIKRSDLEKVFDSAEVKIVLQVIEKLKNKVSFDEATKGYEGSFKDRIVQFLNDNSENN